MQHAIWLLMCVCASLPVALLAQAAPLDPGWHDDQAISVDGTSRYYRYYVPEALTSPPPAVLFLHGGNRSMRTSMAPARNGAAAWPDVAEEHGFILIVPNGTDAQTGDAFGDEQVWNDCRIGAPAEATIEIPPTPFLPAQPGLEPIRPIDLRPYHADVVFQRCHSSGATDHNLTTDGR
jgi:hypothetical protein